MALVSNNFDGGTDGAGTTGQITVANSGNSGNAFNTITPTPPTGTWTYDTTGAYFKLGARVQIASSTAWRAYHSWASVTQVAARVVFTFNGSVPAAAVIASINNTSFSPVFNFATDATGKMAAVTAGPVTLGSTSSPLTAGTAYVAEYQIQPGSATNNGVISAQLYTAANPGTKLINVSSSTANLGTVQGIVRGSLGENDAVATLDITFDEVVYNTGTLTAIGPPPTYAQAAVAASTAVPPSDTADAVALGMTIQGH